MARSIIPLAIFLALACASSLVHSAPAAFPGEADLVTSLPGLDHKPTFKTYSGYVEAENGVFLHYWFVESQSANPAKDPVALWLDGGPGCSAMIGKLMELGPFHLNKNGTLSANPHAWNQKANLLFLESPAGVGFSYKVDGVYASNDESTAIQNFNGLKSFYTKFPHLSDNDFYITGESYAGVYIPTLSVELLKHKFPKNFKGVAIGNGALDWTLVSNSAVHFIYGHGLVDTVDWEAQVKTCCPTSSPWNLRSCDFQGSTNKDCQAVGADMTSTIIKMYTSGINMYDIYADCEASNGTLPSPKQGPSQGPSRLQVAQSLLLDSFSASNSLQKAKITGTTPPCFNMDFMIRYLSRPEVLKALHISEQAWQWYPCRNTSDIGYVKTIPSVKSHIKQMVDSGLKVLVYNGDVDFICNYLGSQWFVEELGYPTSKPYGPWSVNGQVAGFSKYFLPDRRLALVTVRGAGHIAATDKPAETLEMFNHFLKGF